ncbi:LPXTG-motif_cell wall anchor domain [Hexamita inflata]|uniref:LPXTG-motif cell wall anchor domain n=1 Tax=Hexamita inflata TaxID=28002 RepID=A0AA86PP82_9EUKA|nr:LPXTG-motif cell wall anchor domain [Hexamita inflata]CAI9947633.1 LPXTG-motif cell wall anchor domain [Hexamita inflata]
MFIIQKALLHAELLSVGSNVFGKLGVHVDETKLPLSANFQRVADFTQNGVNRVRMGVNHAFATDTRNVLYAWGDNTYQQCGQTVNNVYVSKPMVVPYFAENKIKVAYADGGQHHSIAIDVDGTVYSWGSNFSGQAGRLTGDSSVAPVDTSNLLDGEKATGIATNMLASYMITNQGNVYVWGSCQHALCGAGHTAADILYIPTKMTLAFKVAKMYIGMFGIYFSDDAGQVYASGVNTYGELCLPAQDPEDPVQNPQMINMKDVDDIQASSQHVLFLKQGAVYACGNNKQGQFGDIAAGTYEQPVLISNGVGNVISVAAVNQGSYILSDIGLFSTGTDVTGELALGKPKLVQKKFMMVQINYDLTEIDSLSAHNNYVFIYAQEQVKKGMGAGLITAIVFGSIAGVVLIVVAAIYIYKCSKKPKYSYISEEKNKLVFNDDQW